MNLEGHILTRHLMNALADLSKSFLMIKETADRLRQTLIVGFLRQLCFCNDGLDIQPVRCSPYGFNRHHFFQRTLVANMTCNIQLHLDGCAVDFQSFAVCHGNYTR